jgi:hypothetical protein
MTALMKEYETFINNRFTIYVETIVNFLQRAKKQNDTKTFAEIFDDISDRVKDIELDDPQIKPIVTLAKDIITSRKDPWYHACFEYIPRTDDEEAESCLFFRIVLKYDIPHALQTFLDTFSSYPRYSVARHLITNKSKTCLQMFVSLSPSGNIAREALVSGDIDIMESVLPYIRKHGFPQEYLQINLNALQFLTSHSIISKDDETLFTGVNIDTPRECMKFLLETLQMELDKYLQYYMRLVNIRTATYIYERCNESQKSRFVEQLYHAFMQENIYSYTVDTFDYLQFCMMRGLQVEQRILTHNLWANFRGRFASQRFWVQPYEDETFFYQDFWWRNYFMQHKEEFPPNFRKVITKCITRLEKKKRVIYEGLNSLLCKDVIGVICGYF